MREILDKNLPNQNGQNCAELTYQLMPKLVWSLKRAHTPKSTQVLKGQNKTKLCPNNTPTTADNEITNDPRCWCVWVKCGYLAPLRKVGKTLFCPTSARVPGS